MLYDDLEEWNGEEEGGSGGKGYMYNCDCFALIYSRDHHNIVKQLSCNKRKFQIELLYNPTISLLSTYLKESKGATHPNIQCSIVYDSQDKDAT